MAICYCLRVIVERVLHTVLCRHNCRTLKAGCANRVPMREACGYVRATYCGGPGHRMSCANILPVFLRQFVCANGAMLLAAMLLVTARTIPKASIS